MSDIYFQYNKITGEYMGNSVEHIDNDLVGSTAIEPCEYEQDPTTFDFITMPYFINGAWISKEI